MQNILNIVSLSIGLIFINVIACGQTFLSNNQSFTTSINSISIKYDNDLFVGEDYGNTQNVQVNIYTPRFEENAIFKLILGTKKDEQTKYGFGIQHSAFTPKKLSAEDVQFGDYPYAALLLFNFYREHIFKEKALIIGNSANIGFIGPGAGGKAIQTGIHRVTDDVIPQGWHNQIKNDVLLNYNIKVEKLLLSWSNNLMVSGTAQASIGTYFTGVSFGGNAQVGLFNHSFLEGESKKIEFSVYANPSIHFIGFDATLQGGLFSNKNAYTIDNKSLKRVIYSSTIGFALKIKSLSVSIHKFVNSEQFTGIGLKQNAGLSLRFDF